MVSFLTKYWFLILITAVISYLIGGINSSLVVTKFLGIKKDVRTLGSGNAGFTNTLRTVGKKAAILTFLGDFIKGVLAVFISVKIYSIVCTEDSGILGLKFFACLASFMCILGHMYPCFFGFRGGKGILTAWAASLLIDYRIFLVLISVFLIVFIFTKVVSIASICAAIIYPISAFFISSFTATQKDEIIIITLFSFLSALMVLIRHRGNIVRIINGSEKKISVGRGN